MADDVRHLDVSNVPDLVHGEPAADVKVAKEVAIAFEKTIKLLFSQAGEGEAD